MKTLNRITGILCAEFVVMIMLLVVPAMHCTSNSSVTISCYGEIAYDVSLPNPSESLWLEFVQLFIVPLITAIFGLVLGNLLLDYVRGRLQRRKDGEFKTPVVIKPLARNA